MFDIKISDHRLDYDEAIGWGLQGSYVYKELQYENSSYPTFYAKCVEEKSEATPTEVTLGDNTITMYINANGHQFYDIADKEAVDAWYDTYGTAWYYGVDTSAERIFLPRDNYFYLTGKAMGNGMTLGLTNGTVDKGLGFSTSGNAHLFPSGGIGSAVGSTTGTSAGFTTEQFVGITTDPDKSGIVLEANKDKYLYICVGNTTVNEALTNVTDITSSENDTLPLGYSTYQADNLSSLAWLKSTGFFESGLTYVTFYNEYRTRIGEKFSGGYVRSVDDTYTDYDYVINTADETFRLPLLNGSEDLISDKKENLTTTASDDEYTTNKNGLYNFAVQASSSNCFIQLTNKTTGQKSENFCDANTNFISVSLSANKGDVVSVVYRNCSIRQFLFIPYRGNGPLYFYVGAVAQNAPIVNLGRIQETYTTKSMVDGQWVNRFETLASNLSMGYQVTKTFDLSNILPNDGYNYEVMFTITAVTGSANGNCAEIGAQSDILRGTNRVAQTITRTSATMQTSSSFILPVGGRRLIEVWQIHNSTCTLSFLRTIGYRRIGTNL